MPKTNKCLRCKETMPANSSFCPACGMTNHTATATRGLKVEKKLEAKANKRNFWRIITNFIRIGSR